MQADPIVEWQRLTLLYREMGDGELEELGADITDLTEVAQQVLRDELRKRGLDGPRGPNKEPNHTERFAAPTWNSHGDWPEDEEAAAEGGEPVEFTWKTPLCDCKDREEAWQIQEVLRQAGIESWFEGPGSRDGRGLFNPRIVVAADQLEKAHEIVSRPIPREIVEQSKLPDEEYVPPVCPSCGAEDPILEGADPANSWRCETCGKQWTDATEEAQECPEQQKTTLNARQEENPFDTGPLLMG
jgi:ribosomal protein L37AE/L43A